MKLMQLYAQVGEIFYAFTRVKELGVALSL